MEGQRNKLKEKIAKGKQPLDNELEKIKNNAFQASRTFEFSLNISNEIRISLYILQYILGKINPTNVNTKLMRDFNARIAGLKEKIRTHSQSLNDEHRLTMVQNGLNQLNECLKKADDGQKEVVKSLENFFMLERITPGCCTN